MEYQTGNGERQTGRRSAALLRKEFANETAVTFILNAGEEFGAELFYCFRAVEWQRLILYAAAEVTGHTSGLQYGFDLSIEIYGGIRIRTSIRTPAGLLVCVPRLADFRY